MCMSVHAHSSDHNQAAPTDFTSPARSRLPHGGPALRAQDAAAAGQVGAAGGGQHPRRCVCRLGVGVRVGSCGSSQTCGMRWMGRRSLLV